MILAVNEVMNVAMAARTHQQEFSWTTCIEILGKKLESAAVSHGPGGCCSFC